MERDTGLTESELDVLGCLVDGDQPTEHVVDMLREDPATPVAQRDAETRLVALEGRGLVSRSHEFAADAIRGAFETDWWHVTESGWIALADSGEYLHDEFDLTAAWPPVFQAVVVLLAAGPLTVSEMIERLRSAWGDPPGPPAHVARMTGGPLASIGDDRFVRMVERRVGHLALSGLLSPDCRRPTDGPVRWALTDEGRAAAPSQVQLTPSGLPSSPCDHLTPE